MRLPRKLLSIAVITLSVGVVFGAIPASAAKNSGPDMAAAAAAGCTEPAPRWFDLYSQEHQDPTRAGGANGWGYIWVDPAIDPNATVRWFPTCIELTIKDEAADGMAAVAWVTLTTRDGSTVQFVLDRADGYGYSVSRTYALPPSRDVYVFVCRAAGSNWRDNCSARG